jgi:predicted nucleic acid-binding protein
MENNIYVDTNVFIDLMDSTRPFYKGSFSLIKSSITEGKILYINSDTITNAFYILNRTHATLSLISLMQKMVALFVVVAVEHEEVMFALSLC